MFFSTFILSVLGGILGRMGGSDKYNTKWRDLGIPLLCVFPLTLLLLGVSALWVSLICVPLMLGALSTYWDELFGYDNLWFSGFAVGVSVFPISIYAHKWVGFFIRSFMLMIIWKLLNKYLPCKVLIWRRDVAEEFLRYFTTIITVPLLAI